MARGSVGFYKKPDASPKPTLYQPFKALERDTGTFLGGPEETTAPSLSAGLPARAEKAWLLGVLRLHSAQNQALKTP